MNETIVVENGQAAVATTSVSGTLSPASSATDTIAIVDTPAGKQAALKVFNLNGGGGGGGALPDNAVLNNSSDTGIAIGVDTTANSIHATAIGSYAKAGDVQSTAIGFQAKADVDGQGGSVAVGQGSVAKNYSVSLGDSCSAAGMRSLAIGNQAIATANAAVMINLTTTKGTNNNPNTVRIRNQNGDFEVMDADGNVPLERLTYVTNQIGDISSALTAILGE